MNNLNFEVHSKQVLNFLKKLKAEAPSISSRDIFRRYVMWEALIKSPELIIN